MALNEENEEVKKLIEQIILDICDEARKQVIQEAIGRMQDHFKRKQELLIKNAEVPTSADAFFSGLADLLALHPDIED